MARKKKYEEVKEGYWIYSIKIPANNQYYIGVSKLKCSQRWKKTNYKGTALEPYFSEWDNLIKTVIKDGLTKTEALKMEDDLIQALRFIDLCVNSNRSGLIEVSDKNAYMREYNKQYYEDNKEQINEYQREYRENNPEYQKQWRENNPDYMKQWRENNPDYMKQWREDNKEKIKEYQRQRYQKKKIEKQNQQLNLFS